MKTGKELTENQLNELKVIATELKGVIHKEENNFIISTDGTTSGSHIIIWGDPKVQFINATFYGGYALPEYDSYRQKISNIFTGMDIAKNKIDIDIKL